MAGLMRQAVSPLRRVYLFGFCWMGVLLMPVIVPFLIDRGVTAGDVLTLQAVLSAVIIILELPTGYLCDRFGRVPVLRLGAACNLAGYVALMAAHGFAVLVCVHIVLGVGISLVSGADVALLYDLLDETEADRPTRRRALADYQFAQVTGEASAALLGGALAALSLAAVGWANAAVTLVPLLVALTLRPPPRAAQQSAPPLAGMAEAIGYILRARSRLLVFGNLVIWSLSTFTAVWLLQPYWRVQSVPLSWFGVLWAGTLLTVGIAARFAHRAERVLGARGVLLVIALTPVAGYAGMAAGGGIVGVACGFLFYVSRGFNAVHLREAFNHGLPPHLRGTANSAASGTVRLSFALLGPAVGALLDARGIEAVLWSLAALFSLAVAGVAVPLLRAGAGR
ncbi:MAG: MFS transporter [Acetobacteraceae bacterium]|nr:MFS transporter [Acetobacteraceae bacterium]